MNLNIYVATHKRFEEDLPSYYTPILVGSYDKDIQEYIRDDYGENEISEKNKNYCELTGLYWIWKNINTDYIGLCHYRRYFKGKKSKYIQKDEVERILSKYDIIVPKRWQYLKTVYDDYKKKHYEKDILMCKKVIEKKYPEYIESFDKVLNRDYIFLYNMFIGKKEIMDKYFQWLFDILSEVEEQIDISEYDDYQKRIYGFLAERLFNVWLEYNQYKLKEVKVIKLGQPYYLNFAIKFKGLIKKMIGGVITK